MEQKTRKKHPITVNIGFRNFYTVIHTAICYRESATTSSAPTCLHNAPVFTSSYKYTVSQKTCDYIFYNNFNNKCPITIIFGIVSGKSMCNRKMVSFPTSPI